MAPCPSTSAPRALRSALSLSLGLLALAALATGAQAAIDTEASALDVAESIETVPDSIVDAQWIERPPGGSPSAVATTFLADFPIHGDSYALLSTGDASDADNADPSYLASTDNAGLPVRGESDKDALVLRIGIDACTDGFLSFDYRFLSEEYPNWIQGRFNDTFVAELDGTSWTNTGSETSAPLAFAIESVNSAAFTPGAATGTPYNGATLVRTASTSITAGTHDLYISLYDMGRASFDSAVFIDNLQFPTDCTDPCEDPDDPACCETDCEPTCEGSDDPLCDVHPCPGGLAWDADGGFIPLIAPESIFAEAFVATDCGPCPVPSASAYSETDVLRPSGSGDVDADACLGMPCSLSTPPHVHYEATQDGAWTLVWPGGTLYAEAGVLVPVLDYDLDGGIVTDLADCL